ncbi:MAG: hypothetical protein CMC55_07415 [Flavobacteriaceae bacterium]|uniref:hypothetical protein n=1 Tax=Bizionia echini TaxID=649333 RepID=UPI000C8F482E|nr:hypothetical protein [Flavobacteriaceae bacterium]
MTSTQKPPKSFWIISIVALIWNLMGVSAYLMQAFMTDEALSKLPEPEQALYHDVPAWVTAAFAIAVFGGTLGCIGLLLRKKWSKPVFILSLIGIIVQMIHNLFISNNMDVYGPGAIIMPIMVLIIGVYLIIYSKAAIQKGWLS